MSAEGRVKTSTLFIRNRKYADNALNLLLQDQWRPADLGEGFQGTHAPSSSLFWVKKTTKESQRKEKPVGKAKKPPPLPPFP